MKKPRQKSYVLTDIPRNRAFNCSTNEWPNYQIFKKYKTREKLDFNANYLVSSTLLLLPVSRLLLAKQLDHLLSVSPASLRDFSVFARRFLPPSETSSEELLLSSVIGFYPFQLTTVPSFVDFCSYTLFSLDFLFGFRKRNV
ncbi:hypothetical protein SLA2020_010180 [Shorea laevis]